MTSTPARLTSLDVFRGVTIAAMIVVNNPGNWNAIYPQLAHAVWNGCTLADLVFPFFIVIMGMALPLAFARRREAPGHDARVARHIWIRALTLVVMGLLLNVAAQPHLDQLRIPGVLQRIGLTYLIAALLVLHVRPRAQLAIAAGLVLAHWALLTLVPFGGFPAGTMTPAHNLASYVDKALFGTHTFTATGDPEGLLGLLSSVATALLGAIAGWWLQRSTSVRMTVIGLAAGGVLAMAVGLAWSHALPFNKALWTGSYAMFSSGLAALAFVACYLSVDVLHVRAWTRPFLWLGVNPLAVYFLSELVGRLIELPVLAPRHGLVSVKDAIFWNGLAPLLGDKGGAWSSCVFAVTYTAVWIAVVGVAVTVRRPSAWRSA